MTDDTASPSTNGAASGADGPFHGKVAVVTGATRGIGREVALALGAGGAHLVALGRTTGALEELDDAVRAAGGPAPTLVPLDLRQTDLVDRLGAALADKHGRVDVLVGAAATIGKLAPVGHITEKAWNEAMAVNATGHFRLIRTLDPLFRRSEGARVVLLTCREAREATAFYGHFAASKAALEALAATYAVETAGAGIAVSVIDPGKAATRLRRQAFPGEKPSTLPTAADAARPVLDALTP